MYNLSEIDKEMKNEKCKLHQPIEDYNDRNVFLLEDFKLKAQHFILMNY